MQQYGVEENEGTSIISSLFRECMECCRIYFNSSYVFFFILEQSHSSQETPLCSLVHDYPYQTVIVNTPPTLGTTLSCLVNQEQNEKKEGKEATRIFSSLPQSHCSGKPCTCKGDYVVLALCTCIGCIPSKSYCHILWRFRLLQPYFGHLSCIPSMCMTHEIHGVLTIWIPV